MSNHHYCAVHGNGCSGHHHLHIAHPHGLPHSGVKNANGVINLGILTVGLILAVTGVDPMGAISTAVISSLTKGKS